MTTPPEYEVYAIKYASREQARSAHFIFDDPHDGPLAMDYYVWAIVGAGGTGGAGRRIVVDLGYDRRFARQSRHLLRTPAEGLQLLGVDPLAVDDVIVTHLHYDHCGSLPDFAKSRIHIQDREMVFATGRFLKWKAFRYGNFVEYTVDFVRAIYDQRVDFVDGDAELAPGVSVHHLGGHTDGLQMVRVWTRRGWLVLASDAAHLYANMEIPNPYPAVFHVGDMLDGFNTLYRLADAPENVIPGHDPLVMQRYPAPSAELEGIVARLDADPI
ncbi:MAG: N-acyl homoserine lactonase family protein [Alphaproteobacteria bacterium]|nr:N-acyl homoserine lactonase family protein [Alphaproteobacteria bacterium]